MVVGGRQALLLTLAAIACTRPPTRSEQPQGPTRLSILGLEYGGSPEHPDAIQPGDRLDQLELWLADGGAFELDDALAAGPVILVWIGGAEHEALMTWVETLDAQLDALEQRSATLVLVRPLEPEAALRWATQIHLQTPVAADPHGALAPHLDLDVGSEPGQSLEFAVLIIREGALVYRKLGGRRPAVDELLAVIDGAADALRCCPGVCVGSPCR